MNTTTKLLSIAAALLCVGCELAIKPPPLPPIPGEPRPPAPPRGEPAPPAEPVPPAGPYAHLPQRKSYTTKASIELKPGCYVGNFVLGRSQLRVRGAGQDQTIIDGNLILKTQCQVSNLTVTGDVIFEGHQAKLIDVDFYGEVRDNGLQNRY